MRQKKSALLLLLCLVVFLQVLGRTQQTQFTNLINRKILQTQVQGTKYTALINVLFPDCQGNCDGNIGNTVKQWATTSLQQVDNAVQVQSGTCAQSSCLNPNSYGSPGYQYQIKFIGTSNSGQGENTYSAQLNSQKQNLVGQIQSLGILQNSQQNLNISIQSVQQGSGINIGGVQIQSISRGATIAVIVIVVVIGLLIIGGIIGCIACCCCVANRKEKGNKKSRSKNSSIQKHQPHQGHTYFHKQLNKEDDTATGVPIKTGSYNLNTQGTMDNNNNKEGYENGEKYHGGKREAHFDLASPGMDDQSLVNRSMSEDNSSAIQPTKSGKMNREQSSTLSQIQTMLKENFSSTVGFVTASTIDREKRNNLLKLEKYMSRVYEKDDGVFLDQYQLQGDSFTKDGGSSRVYFAKIIESEQEVAVKFFLQEEAFDREFNIYVDHPNLVGRSTPSVREVGEGGNYIGQDGKRQWQPSYIVMDKGLDLRDWIKQRRLNVNLTLRTFYQIVKCVQYLHEVKIAHNDIKPGNVLWVPGLQAWRLIDYSVAAEFNEKRPIEFSLEYCAPEVLAAHEKRQGDIISGPEVDIWSLGLLILELFTGNSIIGSSMSEAEARNMLLGNQPLPHESDPTILDNLPDALAAITLKMLNRYKEDRPTIQEVRKVVSDLVEKQSQLVLQKVVGIYPVSDIEEAFKDVNYGQKKGAAIALNVVLDELMFTKGKPLQMQSAPIKKGSLLNDSDVVYQLRAGFKYRLHFFIQYVDETRTYDLPIQNVSSILLTPKDGKKIEQLPMVLQHNDLLWHGYIEWDPSTHQSEELSSLTSNMKKLGGRAELQLDIILQVASGKDILISQPILVAINSQQANLDNLRQEPAEWDTTGTVDAFKEGGVILAKLEKQNEGGQRQESLNSGAQHHINPQDSIDNQQSFNNDQQYSAEYSQ